MKAFDRILGVWAIIVIVVWAAQSHWLRVAAMIALVIAIGLIHKVWARRGHPAGGR